MEIDFMRILATIINFIILILILKHFFWDKIKRAIDARQEAIDETILKADEDEEKARRLRLDNERILKSAKEEGRKLREEQKKEADRIYKEIVDDAHREAEAIINRANIEIQREEEKVKYELKQQVVDISVMLSEKALGESIDESKHRELINDFIEKVGI